MIDRTNIDTMVDGKSIMLTIDEEDGGMPSITTPHGNHVIETLDDGGKYLIRDAAALDGSLAILERGWTVRPVTSDERASWTHHGRVMVGQPSAQPYAAPMEEAEPAPEPEYINNLHGGVPSTVGAIYEVHEPAVDSEFGEE